MLHNGDFTKATVNGRKAGLCVHNGCIWLQSYVAAWDKPSADGYDAIPRHSFFRHIPLSYMTFESFAEFRDSYLTISNPLYITQIALPGEDGFEREIRRRNRNATETATETATATTASETAASGASETQTAARRPDIDFYLPNYRTDNIYRGQHGYHNSQRAGFLNQPSVPFTGHRIGVELEVEANSREKFDEINSKKSNWFTRERDGSLGLYGIEFITVPLLPDDAKSYRTWQPLCEYLKSRAKSWNTGRCGLHVHIGREILGENEDERQMTLGKLLIFYQGEVENWVKSTAVFGRERCYHQPDGDTAELNAVKCLGSSVLKDPEVFKKVDRAMKAKFNESRYYAINLRNDHTIEFRKGRGSINADRIIAVVTMTEAVCLFAKETDAHDLTLENFRSWLFNHVPCGNPLFRYLNITQPDA